MGWFGALPGSDLSKSGHAAKSSHKPRYARTPRRGIGTTRSASSMTITVASPDPRNQDARIADPSRFRIANAVHVKRAGGCGGAAAPARIRKPTYATDANTRRSAATLQPPVAATASNPETPRVRLTA